MIVVSCGRFVLEQKKKTKNKSQRLIKECARKGKENNHSENNVYSIYTHITILLLLLLILLADEIKAI